MGGESQRKLTGGIQFRIDSPPLPKGALLAGGKRLAPTEADSGDKSAQGDRGDSAKIFYIFAALNSK